MNLEINKREIVDPYYHACVVDLYNLENVN